MPFPDVPTVLYSIHYWVTETKNLCDPLTDVRTAIYIQSFLLIVPFVANVVCGHCYLHDQFEECLALM